MVFAELELPLDVPDDIKAIAICDEIADMGSGAMGEGEMLRAAQTFTWGVHRCTHSSTMFNNLAVALAMLASDREGKGRVRMLCESLASADIAAARGHADSAELLNAIKESLGAADSCGELQRGQASALTDLARQNSSNHVQTVDALCADASFATVIPTEVERERGQWSSLQLRSILVLFHVCGVAAFRQLVPEALLAEVETARRSHIEELAASPYQGKLDTERRGKHRLETRLPLRSPFTNDNLTHGPLLLPLVRLSVGQRAELDTFSAIETKAGSVDQVWHVDAPTPDGSSERLGSPLVGVVAVVPLVSISNSNGATSFLAGSHVDMGNERFWVGDDNGDGASSITPRLTFSAGVGDVILFDLRLRHRGGANKAKEPRPVLYMSYVQDWFLDATNFKSKQTHTWDKLSQSGKKLFSRLDARSYVQELEDKLVACGVDTSALASRSKYSPSKLEL